jgi:hypothetical protein
MKTIIAIAGLIGAIAFSTAALAADSYGTPGTTVATGETTCAGAGSFGAFGPGENLGIAFAPGNGNPEHDTSLASYPGPGTDGTQTGINNSTLCGQPN